MRLISIVIITRNRPEMIQKCLEHVQAQQGADYEVIVIDSSSNQASSDIITAFPDVRYHYLGDVKDSMPMARNVGIQMAKGEIIAFIDDDSMIAPGWLTALREGYCDEMVGAVGGRALDNGIGCQAPDPDLIGRILDSTELTTYFCADPSKIIAVDHVGGFNMSYRVRLLKSLGGFDPTFSGTNYREETDVCLRVKRAGYRILFNPKMMVDHLRAPREGVERKFSDPRFQYYHARNTLYFFVKHYGLLNRKPIRFAARNTRSCFRQSLKSPVLYYRMLFAAIIGILAGYTATIRYFFSKDYRLYPAQLGTDTHLSEPQENFAQKQA